MCCLRKPLIPPCRYLLRVTIARAYGGSMVQDVQLWVRNYEEPIEEVTPPIKASHAAPAPTRTSVTITTPTLMLSATAKAWQCCVLVHCCPRWCELPRCRLVHSLLFHRWTRRRCCPTVVAEDVGASSLCITAPMCTTSCLMTADACACSMAQQTHRVLLGCAC